MIHRQQLHRGLRLLTEDPSGPGGPVKIITAHRVTQVDLDRNTVLCEDGSEVDSDVLIGADGVQSKTRAAVQQKYDSHAEPFSTGFNCFRFLIPRETLLADPVTRPIFEILNTFILWESETMKLVSYPCDDKTMNFAAFYPAGLSSATAVTGWSSQGNKNTLTSVFSTWAPEVQKILGHLDPSHIRLH